MVSHGADEGHAENSAYPKIDDGGGHQPVLIAVDRLDSYRLIEESGWLKLLDVNQRLAVAHILPDILLEVMKKNIVHPGGN